MAGICRDCSKRKECKTPCKPVLDELKEPGYLKERWQHDKIIVYSRRPEVRESSMMDEKKMEDYAEDEAVVLSTDNLELTQTRVFCERFFNRKSFKQIAEEFDVKENTAVSMFRNACTQIEKVIMSLDMRKAGWKAAKKSKFDMDEKMFLLTAIFGYSRLEVARIFGMDKGAVCRKMNGMEERYKAAFNQVQA